MRLADDRGETLDECRGDLPDHAALDALMSRLRDRGLDRDDLTAVGHRIVYGGDRHREPQRITPGVVANILALLPVDPIHLPQAIDRFCSESCREQFKAIPEYVLRAMGYRSRRSA
jgi:acetate kinase